MSRLRLGLALAGAAALALGLLGAASARPHAPSKYGGTLVVGMSRGDPDTLDPTVSNSPAAGLVSRAICERLYDRDAKLRLVPVLAAAAPVLSKDKLGVTIQLRKGIQFNDGTPFNAQAVVTTIRRYMTYPGSTNTSAYEHVDSVTATGPYTLVYRLNQRDSTFIGGMPNPLVLSPTQLDKLGDNFASNPVCVGPFMFDNRVAGDHVTVVKSPYYYDRNNVFLDKIVFKPMTVAPAAVAALKAGDIQALVEVDPTELPGIKETASLRVLETDSLGWLGVFINIGNKNGRGSLPYAKNVGTPLSSSAKLRQAFEEAIDRNAMSRVVFDGLVKPSCTPVAPSNALWYEPTKVPCTPYNPQHAKKLVAESGIPNPTVHLLIRSRTDEIREAAFIQAQEAAVGINVVIDVTDTLGSTSRRDSGQFDAAVGGSVSGFVDPDANIGRYVATSGSTNYSGYSNPRLDLILSNGVKATSVEARSTLYRVAQQIVQNDRPIIVFYNPITIAAYSASLTGVELTYNGVASFAHARYR